MDDFEEREKLSNTKTLKKMTDRTPEERREISQRAGRASVKRRRELKATREYLRELLALPVEGLEAVGLPRRDGNHLAAITVALVQRAEAGDVRAAELVLKMLGEYPSEKMELQATTSQAMPDTITIQYVAPDPSKFDNMTEGDIRHYLENRKTHLENMKQLPER